MVAGFAIIINTLHQQLQSLKTVHTHAAHVRLRLTCKHPARRSPGTWKLSPHVLHGGVAREGGVTLFPLVDDVGTDGGADDEEEEEDLPRAATWRGGGAWTTPPPLCVCERVSERERARIGVGDQSNPAARRWRPLRWRR